MEKMKEMIFAKVLAEYREYTEARDYAYEVGTEDATSYASKACSRWIALEDLVEYLGLEDEYEDWKIKVNH